MRLVLEQVEADNFNGEGASLDPRDRNWTITETVAVSGALDTVKASGIARTTNPTAVSDGDNQRFSVDDLGRQLVRPVPGKRFNINRLCDFDDWNRNNS